MTNDVTAETATDEVTEEVPTEEAPAADETTDDETPAAEPEDPAAGLKSALQKERKARREAERRARELDNRLKAADMSPDEAALEAARQEAAAQATEAANARIVRSEIRAAAKGLLADPADAFAYLDASEIEVDENGDVDVDAINDALADLIRRKPYLAANSAKFAASADQGAKRPSTPSQLTRSDLSRMTPEQINAARREGRLDSLMGKSS